MCTTQRKFHLARRPFQLSAIAFAVLSLSGVAMADEDEVAALIKPDSSVSIGIGNWSGDRPRLGTYDAMREGQTYGSVDAEIAQRDDATGTWLKLDASNVGMDNPRIKGEYLRQGDMGVTLEYDRITSDNPNTFNTRLLGIGGTSLTPSTAALPSPVRSIKLGTDREITSVGFYKSLMPELAFNFNFKNELKTGTRPWGRGGQAEFAVEPIDSTTQQMELALHYATKTWQLSGGYNASWYENRYSLVTVRNAGLGVANNTSTYLSLPMDNQAQQIFLNGGYNFTQTTRGTFKAEYAIATQNERLPTSDIPLLGYNGVPKSLNGEVHTSLLQLGLTSRPMKDLSLVANLRYHEVDDKTPVNRFVAPVTSNASLATNNPLACGTCVDNTPLDFKTLSGKLEGTYRLSDMNSLTAGIDQRSQERTIPVGNSFGAGGTDTQRVVPYRTKLDETTARLEFRRSLSDTLNGSVSYANARRTGSAYRLVAPTSAGNTIGAATGFADIGNLINPLNIADRERNKIRLALDWSVSESLNVQFNVEEGRDRYDTSAARPFGLRDGVSQFMSLDASYNINDKWKLNAWYSYDFSQAKQSAARASNGGGNAAVKDINLEDVGNSLGLGLRGDYSSKTSIGADLEITHNLSKYQQTLNTLTGAAPTVTVPVVLGLPDVQNRVVKLKLFSKYALNKQSDVRIDLVHERWTTDDWTWQFANGTPFAYTGGNTGGVALDGTTVTANQNQTNDYISVRYTFKF